MLQRRFFLTQMVAAPAIIRVGSLMPISLLADRIVEPSMAPAIVPASSLMPISAPKLKYIVRVILTENGQTLAQTVFDAEMAMAAEMATRQWLDILAEQSSALNHTWQIHVVRA